MSKEVRANYFKGFDGKNVFGVDLGTSAKVRDSFSLAESFAISFLMDRKSDDMGKAPLITRTQITKAFMLEVKSANAKVNELCKSGKKIKDIDKDLLKMASIIKGGKANASVVIDKSAVFTAVRHLYLTQEVLFSVALSADGDFTIKQADYIPGLIEEK